MADPMTIGMIALSAAGSAIEGAGANSEARSEARALEQNAIEAGTQGAEDALYSLRQGRLEAGADLAGSAAGGVGAGNGTLADIMRANAEARWQQAFNIQQQAGREAAGLRAQASAARSRGKAALLGGLVRAGATALGGVRDANNAAKAGAANERRRQSERQGPGPMGRIPLPKTAGKVTGG